MWHDIFRSYIASVPELEASEKKKNARSFIFWQVNLSFIVKWFYAFCQEFFSLLFVKWLLTIKKELSFVSKILHNISSN